MGFPIVNGSDITRKWHGERWPGELLRLRGFTLIELLVVMAIIALLMTLALPRYFSSLQHSREVALAQNLTTVRDTIDKFYADRGVYPDSLQQLVAERYLKALPIDPVTESAETWVLLPPEPPAKGGVADIRSGAPGAMRDGQSYADL